MSDFDNMELSEDTEMGDALTSAFDQHDENIAKEVVAAPAETIAPVQTGLAGVSDEVPAPVPETEEAPAKSNAPQSWGVAEREAWGGIPENVQAQIQKRESEKWGEYARDIVEHKNAIKILGQEVRGLSRTIKGLRRKKGQVSAGG